MRTVLRVISLLLLGLWLGAAIFFSAAVAPNVFGVLRGAELANAGALAGSIVSRLLAIINQAGFEIGLFVVIVSFFTMRGQRPITQFVGLLSLTIMAIMNALAHWVIAARMARLRTAFHQSVDQLAPWNPQRLEFDRLHRYSVAMLSVAIVAALIAFVLTASRGNKSVPPASAGGSGTQD